MMKFACFERTIEAMYKYVIPKPREQCSKSEQLAVTFIAGYIAGIFCAIVSHPADTIVSKLNNEKGLNLFDAIRRIGFAGKVVALSSLSFVWNFISSNIFRYLERPWRTNHNDWHIDGSTMVHL
jgi:solute carrier family 25 (mitochondrial phosphate transporter), member 3